MSEMIEIGALWLKQAKDGSKFMTGTLNKNTSILVFANKHKKADNHPDYRLFFAPAREKTVQAAPGLEPPTAAQGVTEEDVPF